MSEAKDLLKKKEKRRKEKGKKGSVHMEATNVTLRMDKGLKEQADELFAELGLTFTAAVNLFIRKSLRTRGIPFDVDMSPARTDRVAMNAAFEQLLASTEAQARLGRIVPGNPSGYGMSLTAEELEEAANAAL